MLFIKKLKKLLSFCCWLLNLGGFVLPSECWTAPEVFGSLGLGEKIVTESIPPARFHVQKIIACNPSDCLPVSFELDRACGVKYSIHDFNFHFGEHQIVFDDLAQDKSCFCSCESRPNTDGGVANPFYGMVGQVYQPAKNFHVFKNNAPRWNVYDVVFPTGTSQSSLAKESFKVFIDEAFLEKKAQEIIQALGYFYQIALHPSIVQCAFGKLETEVQQQWTQKVQDHLFRKGSFSSQPAGGLRRSEDTVFFLHETSPYYSKPTLAFHGLFLQMKLNQHMVGQYFRNIPFYYGFNQKLMEAMLSPQSQPLTQFGRFGVLAGIHAHQIFLNLLSSIKPFAELKESKEHCQIRAYSQCVMQSFFN